MATNEDHIQANEDSAAGPAPSDSTSSQNLPAEPATSPAPSSASHRSRDVTLDAYEQVKHTRSGALWFGLMAGAVVLLVLLTFIVQNLGSTEITLLFWSANLPLGVSLLIAAILGALIVGLAGGLRILQLRRAAKKLRH